jgi:hypothetical protein
VGYKSKIKDSKSIINDNGMEIIFRNTWLFDFYFKDVSGITVENFLDADDFYLLNGILIRSADIELRSNANDL